MTINQAKKKYSDAQQINVEHEDYPNKNDIESFVIEQFGDVKILYTKIGKTKSLVIYSHKAFVDDFFVKENQRIEEESNKYIQRLDKMINSIKMERKPEKLFDIELLNAMNIKVGKKVLENSGGCIAKIVSVDEYNGIGLVVLNRGEPDWDKPIYVSSLGIDKGYHQIIN